MNINRPAYSNLVKDIKAGKFVLTGELEPEKVTSIDEVLESARAMKPYVKLQPMLQTTRWHMPT
ncbi:MAG: hypothetical protein ACTSPB_26850 [Candidatus Thorarchaeota archaeon]